MMQVGKAVGDGDAERRVDGSRHAQEHLEPDEAFLKSVDKIGLEALMKRANLDVRALHAGSTQ